MKCYQRILSLSLIWLVFSDQVLAFKQASKTDINIWLNSISQNLQSVKEVSSKTKNDLEARQALKNIDVELINKFRKLTEELKTRISEIEAKIKNLADQIRKLNEQAKKLEQTARKIEEVMSAISEAFEEAGDAENSQKILFSLSQDRQKAAKLLEAVENNNRSTILSLLKQNITAQVEVREVKNENGAMLVFRVGNLIHCLSTKTLCGGKNASLTKTNVRNVKSAEEIVQAVNNLNEETKATNEEVQESSFRDSIRP